MLHDSVAQNRRAVVSSFHAWERRPSRFPHGLRHAAAPRHGHAAGLQRCSKLFPFSVAFARSRPASRVRRSADGRATGAVAALFASRRRHASRALCNAAPAPRARAVDARRTASIRAPRRRRRRRRRGPLRRRRRRRAGAVRRPVEDPLRRRQVRVAALRRRRVHRHGRVHGHRRRVLLDARGGRRRRLQRRRRGAAGRRARRDAPRLRRERRARPAQGHRRRGQGPRPRRRPRVERGRLARGRKRVRTSQLQSGCFFFERARADPH